MLRIVLLLHLIGLALLFGGLFSHLIILGIHQSSPLLTDREGSERMARTIISRVQIPGLYVVIGSGVLLLWILGWDLLQQGWLQFKLLFVFWQALATRLMFRNAAAFQSLRSQSDDRDSDRLVSLKDNHRMIGYVTLLSFLFVCIFSLWKPF